MRRFAGQFFKSGIWQFTYTITWMLYYVLWIWQSLQINFWFHQGKLFANQVKNKKYCKNYYQIYMWWINCKDIKY